MPAILDKERRDALRDAERRVRELMDPIREQRKIKAAAARAKREKALMRQEGQRQPRIRDPKYLAWIRQLPCVVTLTREGREVYGCDAAHVRTNYPVAGWGGNPGLGSKPSDWRTVPMSRTAHREQHDCGDEQAFWSDVGIYPPDLCRELHAAFKAGASGIEVIRKFAALASSKRPLKSRGFEPTRTPNRDPVRVGRKR